MFGIESVLTPAERRYPWSMLKRAAVFVGSLVIMALVARTITSRES
jgi:hypothetical protein